MNSKRNKSNSKELWLHGRHAVIAAIQQGKREIFEIWVTGKQEQEVRELLGAQRIPLHVKDGKAFGHKFGEVVHQGIAAKVGPLPDVALHEVTDSKLIVMLDQVEDPHNLGAILRSAAAFGAGAVVVPEHGSAPLSPVALKAAVGAAEIVPVITVTNLNQALDELKQVDFWSIGLAGEAEQTLDQLNVADRKLVLVMGSEGKGLRPLVAKNCDYLAKIPMADSVESLNVSVAAGIALYELNKS